MAKVKERPVRVPSITKKIVTRCGSIYVTITYMDKKPFEVFVASPKGDEHDQMGYCQRGLLDAIGILLSYGLRVGIPYTELAHSIGGIRCGKSISKVQGKGNNLLSCPDAIAKALVESLDKI